MKLDKWIKETGPKKISETLGVDQSTISLWKSGKSCPRAKTMIGIHKMSQGRVSYQDMVTHFGGAK